MLAMKAQNDWRDVRRPQVAMHFLLVLLRLLVRERPQEAKKTNSFISL